MTVRTMFNPPREPGQKFTQPSETIPNQAESMKSIIERYKRGMLPDVGAKPIYESEMELETTGRRIEEMDLVERQELMEENAAKMDKIITDRQKYLAEKEKESAAAEFEQRVEERAQEIVQENNPSGQ